jgi:AmmeMemoRadiSam system protein B
LKADFRREDLKLVPLIVGHPPEDRRQAVAAALAKYWADDATFFVISSDFCHWYASPHYIHLADTQGNTL